MDRPSPELVNCPHCGARNFAIDDDCAACRKGLTLVIGPRPRVRRVSFGSAMVAIAVVAVCLAPVRVAPGLCILLAAILLPATARAVLQIEGRKAEGRPMIAEEKVGAYINSTAVTTAILLAATTAFVATCFPAGYCLLSIGQDGLGLIVACIAGAVAAIFVFYRLVRRLWPRKD